MRLAHGYAQYGYPHCRSFVFITDAPASHAVGGQGRRYRRFDGRAPAHICPPRPAGPWTGVRLAEKLDLAASNVNNFAAINVIEPLVKPTRFLSGCLGIDRIVDNIASTALPSQTDCATGGGSNERERSGGRGRRLVIAADSGEDVWHTARAMALASTRGADVTALCLSSGERGESAKASRDGVPVPEIKALRREEASRPGVGPGYDPFLPYARNAAARDGRCLAWRRCGSMGPTERHGEKEPRSDGRLQASRHRRPSRGDSRRGVCAETAAG